MFLVRISFVKQRQPLSNALPVDRSPGVTIECEWRIELVLAVDVDRFMLTLAVPVGVEEEDCCSVELVLLLALSLLLLSAVEMLDMEKLCG